MWRLGGGRGLGLECWVQSQLQRLQRVIVDVGVVALAVLILNDSVSQAGGQVHGVELPLEPTRKVRQSAGGSAVRHDASMPSLDAEAGRLGLLESTTGVSRGSRGLLARALSLCVVSFGLQLCEVEYLR